VQLVLPRFSKLGHPSLCALLKGSVKLHRPIGGMAVPVQASLLGCAHHVMLGPPLCESPTMAPVTPWGL
jgi:hypothetical protein